MASTTLDETITKGKKPTVAQLTQYLHSYGVTTTGLNKASLENLVCSAKEHGSLELDPDGLLEDRGEVILQKLRIDEMTSLPAPNTVTCVSVAADSSFPIITGPIIYNYLKVSNDLAREVLIPHKTEAWGMMEDGHVQELILIIRSL